MSEIDPKLLELGRRQYGPDCQLVKATEWSYTFKSGPNRYGRLSRFLAEPGFEVRAAEIRGRWPAMSEGERQDFAANFYNKNGWTDNDTEILEIIMQEGNDLIWSSCALAMLKHPDRNRAVEFLIERVRLSQSERPPISYMQALGLAGDARAVSVIRPYYERHLKAMEQESVAGVPGDIFFGPIPYHAFLAIAGDLLSITHSEEYEHAIRKYFDHPNEQVRWWAERALNVEGPTTLKRSAEYKKERNH